jgi:hypothetical protein
MYIHVYLLPNIFSRVGVGVSSILVAKVSKAIAIISSIVGLICHMYAMVQYTAYHHEVDELAHRKLIPLFRHRELAEAFAKL